MTKQELIDNLEQNKSKPSIAGAIFSFLLIGLIVCGFNLKEFIAPLPIFILIATVLALIYYLIDKFNPNPRIIKDPHCPSCKKEWIQRDGLMVLSEKICPHCHEEIELN